MHSSVNKNESRTFFGHPYPLGSLFFTEMWERFSFYGIRPLLILFMAATVYDGGMGLARENASAIVGIFAGSMYLAALPGGWLADNWLGQQRAVWYGSILIALGHLSIALSAWLGNDLFFIGLMFIVLGSGLFKTCISVMVGTLYKKGDARRDGGFSLFYMGINIGSFIAPLISGWLIKSHGWHWGFGIGGIGMLVALIIFRVFAVPSMKRYDAEVGLDSTWNSPVAKKNGVGAWLLALALGVAVLVTLISLGTIVINPVAVASVLVYVIAASVALYFIWLFVFAGLSRKERARLLVCFILLVSAAFFWSAFEQKPTSFNLFANDYTNRMIGDFEIPAVWFQSTNALFIIPACAGLRLAPAARKTSVQAAAPQIRHWHPVRGGGLWPDDAGGAERPEQRRGRCVAAVAGGQHPDADARRTVPEPIGLATMATTGAGECAARRWGAWFLRQRAQWHRRRERLWSCEGRSAVAAAGPLCPLLYRAADLRRRTGRADVPVRRMLENSQSSAAQKSVSNA